MKTDLNCQNCSPKLVEQCIARLKLSTGAKWLLREAFATGKVTVLMEKYLKTHCPRLLLTPGDKEPALQPPAETQIEGVPISGESSAAKSRPTSELLEDNPTLLMNAREMQDFLQATASKMVELSAPAPQFDNLVLAVKDTGHCILLPRARVLTLGRLDPLSKTSPDVDLTYDDHHRSIAFLHARVTCRADACFIEDMDSPGGTWLNREPLVPNVQYPLRLGDHLRLGRCELDTIKVPVRWASPEPKYVLYATPTGNFLPLPCKPEVTIGRSDSGRSVPDVDLRGEGDVSFLVSRRHAIIRCVVGNLEVTDVGSSNGTKVDDVRVHQGTWVPIKPGQHLSLGGFCLALDVVRAL